MFSELESRFGPHSIDRFASALNTPLQRGVVGPYPYLSAVNNFFKDHYGREPMALGDLVSRVRKVLAASQVTLHPELMRAPLPARVVLKALTLAKALWLEMGFTWGGTDPGTVVRVELFRASLAVVLCLFFCRGGAEGATTAAYVIGVAMQKLKYFGGWAIDGAI
eukprot:jgi/Tetstr1/439693/TSEL_028112.t1